MGTKTCLECAKEKPADLDHFYVKRQRNGIILQFWPRCKPCHNSWTWKRQGKQYVKKPDVRVRERARYAVTYAIRTGRIIKPASCHECRKAFGSRQLQAHHHRGYSRRLDVIFLCRPCHDRAHN